MNLLVSHIDLCVRNFVKGDLVIDCTDGSMPKIALRSVCCVRLRFPG